MKDELGRTNNKAQAIRSLDKLKLAYLLNDIKFHPEKYPNTPMEWIEWLNIDSGDDIYNL